MRTVWTARRSAESWVIPTAAGCPSSLLEETRQRASTTATTCLCRWEWSQFRRRRPTNPSTQMGRRHSVLLVKRGGTTPSWSPMSSPTWRQNVLSVHYCKRSPRPPAVQPKAVPSCLPAPQWKVQLMEPKANHLPLPAPAITGLLMVSICHQPNTETRSTRPCHPRTQWRRCWRRLDPGSARRRQAKWRMSWSKRSPMWAMIEWTLTRWWETSTNYCRTAEEVRPQAHSGSDTKNGI